MTYYSQQIQRLQEELYPRENLTRRIIRAKQFIDHHYEKQIDLEAISGKAYVSKYHFIRLFKRYYGLTPHQYLTRVRIAKAKELLRDGMTVQRVCFAVGYDSITSFSALFKRMTGTTPSRVKI